MRREMAIVIGVLFLSSSSIAQAQTPSPAPPAHATPVRVAQGTGGGALAAGGVSLLLRRGAPAIWTRLGSIGLGGTAGLLAVDAALLAGVGGGLYLATRAIVGEGPSSVQRGAPAVVSGLGLIAVSVPGILNIVHFAILGIAVPEIGIAATVVFAAGGIALVGWGIYRGYRAWQASHPPALPVGSNVARLTDTRGGALPPGTAPQTANAGMHH